jgi:hypothetical protein
MSDGHANAQSSKAYSVSKKDTISVFGDQLKISLNAVSFEKIPSETSARKYRGMFNLHDVTKSNGFVLNERDTLVFFMTSVDRPNENDGGIATWELINSFLDKMPAYRLESGWNKLGRSYLYFVKLILDAKPNCVFEFNFFFIENKLVLSLLQRPVKEPSMLEQESFTLISPK